jgi:hypothetical protein
MDHAYKNRHPMAWAIIAIVALFSAVAIGAIKGWLPITDSAIGRQACGDCATVESVQAVDTPMAPSDSALAGAEAPAGDGSAADAMDTPTAVPETEGMVAYVYEITVRFEDGRTSVISQAAPPAWQAGDKVKVVDGVILAPG